ncbi:MAG: Eco57I restriction-modification methylase domain-containing protein, partial [Actinobacteria bacterium]|nr:Eco57I restriction-modification methylase domain-containing protein [Actinomycetota bacterium]
LFATEAEKSVGLLELLMQEYDVLLMNPPYGGMTAKAKSYLRDYYERTHHDLYAAFIEQTVDLAKPGGFVGMLTSRTFMFLGMFQKVREEILWDDAVPKLLLDTGLGILDGATVETAATVIRKNVMAGLSSNPASQVCSFCRLDYFNTYIKELAFLESFMHYAHNGAHDLWYRVMLGELSKTPGISYYSYWASPSLRALFMQYPPLDRDVAKKPDQPKIADVKGGFRTLDDPRFIRCFWEVDTEIIGRGKKWVPFAKGGDYAKFYSDFGLLVNWENEGEEIRDYATLKGRSRSLDNEAFYFHEGLTHSYITTIGLIAGFGIRYLPPGIIFGHAERAIFSIRTDQLWAFLGLISARLFLIERLMLNPTRKWEAIDGANMPTVVEPSLRLELQAHEAYDILREINTANETSTVYIKPLILQVLHNYNPEEHPIMRHPFAEQFRWADWPSLRKIRSICWENIKKELKQDATAMQEIKPSLRLLAELAINREEETSKRIEELQKQIDEEVYRIYEISDEDRALIEKEIALRKGEVVGEAEPIEEEGLEEAADGAGVLTIDINQQVRNHVERLISFYVKQSVEEDPDGIVPFDESFEDNLLRRVRGKIARDFGEGQVGEIEGEIAEILGKSLGEWLLRDYFDFHVSLYKRRPIFWQLISSPIGRTKTPAFSCLVNYHKLTRDTIPKIQAFYLTKVKQRAEFEKDRLFVELEEARATKDAQKVRRLEKAYNTAASTFDELVNFEGIFATIHNPREDKTKLPANPKWVDQR